MTNGELKVSDYSDEDEDPDVEEEGDFGDNREIFTGKQAQKLEPEEIDEMKKQRKGEEIIETIANNN